MCRPLEDQSRPRRRTGRRQSSGGAATKCSVAYAANARLVPQGVLLAYFYQEPTVAITNTDIICVPLTGSEEAGESWLVFFISSR
jgi:hypothetical protein